MDTQIDPRMFNLRTDGLPADVPGAALKLQYATVFAATPTTIGIAFDREIDTDHLDNGRTYRLIGITAHGHPVIEAGGI